MASNRVVGSEGAMAAVVAVDRGEADHGRAVARGGEAERHGGVLAKDRATLYQQRHV